MRKRAKLFYLVAIVTFIFTVNGFAGEDRAIDDSIYIYDFAYGGNGCPQGSVDALMTSSYGYISVFFDEFYASSAESSSGRDRKSCNMGLSIHVPQGLTVALVQVDYRGHVDVPPGGYAEFMADYFFAGEITGASFSKEWYDSLKWIEDDFVVSDKFYTGAVVYGECGKDVIMRANTSIKAYEDESTGADAYAAVDTADIGTSIIYQLKWKSCD
ncbi:MAG: DUF4360 domain-containing protein [Desulfobacteraceae bacterium]|nr:DUF4360 domain-containing protein [Desulfobacteraceae bacterium]